jgi:hypothetical protein
MLNQPCVTRSNDISTNDFVRCIIQWDAVFGTVIHSMFDTSHNEVLGICVVATILQYTCNYVCSILYIVLHSTTLPSSLHGMLPSTHDALEHTPIHALQSGTPNCSWWCTRSLLNCTLPRKLTTHFQGHSPGHYQIRSQMRSITHSQFAWLSAPISALKMLSIPLLCTLPSTLARDKTHPISLDYVLPRMHLGTWSRDLLSWRRQPMEGTWWEVGGSDQFHDIGWYYCPSLGCSTIRSHNALRSWCWQFQPDILQER